MVESINYIQSLICETNLSEKIHDYNASIIATNFFAKSLQDKKDKDDYFSKHNEEDKMINLILEDELKKYYELCKNKKCELVVIIQKLKQYIDYLFINEKTAKEIKKIFDEVTNWHFNSTVTINLIHDDNLFIKFEYEIKNKI